WLKMTALTFHYETQPLPTPVAWYAHQLPPAVQIASCGIMFFIELGLPFFIILPRRPRVLAFWGISLLMLLIIISGNYTFFNLLAPALSVVPLDDRHLPPFLSRIVPRPSAGPDHSRVRKYLVTALAVF